MIHGPGRAGRRSWLSYSSRLTQSQSPEWRWAASVRAIVAFTAVVVAADVLNFAPAVFFAAFVILVGGSVLTAAIAFGLGGQHAVRRWMQGRDRGHASRLKQEDEVSLWRHL